MHRDYIYSSWMSDFIPPVLKEGLDSNLYDELQPVTGAEAIETSLKLASRVRLNE